MTPPSHGRYAREFLAGWGTMDFNGHMANTAYLDLAADVRMAFFAEHGFPPCEFRRLAIGPVMQKDELEYFREVGLYDTVTVTYATLAMSADGARFVVENEIWSAARRAGGHGTLDGRLARPAGAEARRSAAGPAGGLRGGPARAGTLSSCLLHMEAPRNRNLNDARRRASRLAHPTGCGAEPAGSYTMRAGRGAGSSRSRRMSNCDPSTPEG